MAIINPWIFYLIDVLSSLKGISLTVIVLTILGLIATGLVTVIAKCDSFYDDDTARFVTLSIKLLKKLLIVLCISFGVYTVTPSEETMYKMLVAQNVTYENVDKATEAIKDGVDYIFKKLGKEDKKNE